MRLTARLAGRRAYLDANVFIYAVEGFAPFDEALVSLPDGIERQEIEAVTSELTLAEVLVVPIREGAQSTVDRYVQTIRSQDGLSVVPVTREILVEAARLRATNRLKLADAIHVATALASGCGVFLTNDDRPRVPKRLDVLRIADFAA